MRAKFLVWFFALPMLKPFAQRVAQWYLRRQGPAALLRSLARTSGNGNGGGSLQRPPWPFVTNS